MSKLRWLVVPCVVALMLLGGVFFSAQPASTAMDVAVPATQEPAVPQAVTLTLEIPDTTLALDRGEMVSLTAHTHYSGTDVLTYTATTSPSDYFTMSLAGAMLHITSTSAVTGGVFPVDVAVTDGVYTATDHFTVTVESASPLVTLTLAIADRTLALNGAEMLDLHTFTDYSGAMANLTYTATTPSSAYFSATVTGTHYLNIASTSATQGGDFGVDVTVSDGVSTTMDAFTVTVESATVPTLSLSIPAATVGVPVRDESRTFDLWDFTTYHLSDKSGLVYTLTLDYGYYITGTLVNDHYIVMTGTTTLEGKTTDFQIEVSDGTLYYAVLVEFVTNAYPPLHFYGYYDSAPNPFYVFAERTSYLVYDDGYNNPEPLNGFVRMAQYADHFTVDENVPAGLGARVITDTINCSYTWCDYLTFTPEAGFMGTHYVSVTAWSANGLSTMDVLTVTVLQQVNLPFITRGFPPAVKLLPIQTDGDGLYRVDWEVRGGGHDGFELQYATNPQFTDAQSEQLSSYYSSYLAETLTPGTYYWRIRAYNAQQNFGWSNTQAVVVGNYAYLYVEPLCAFGLRVEIWGPVSDSQDYASGWCGDRDYWRSVPAGTYTTRLSWLGGSIVDNVGGTYLGGGKEYIIIADQRPPTWREY